MKKIKILLFLLAVTIIPSLLIWMPFFLRLKTFWGIPLPENGMATIISNYDGPLYLIVSKTLYNVSSIRENFQIPLSAEYYAAHFPLFPLLIRGLSFIFGYPYAGLLVTIFSSFLAIYFFYRLASQFVTERQALFLTLIFSVFPARFLIVRSIVSADPLFIATVLASVYYFQGKNYLLASLWGVAAAITKSPGILLFVAYSGHLLTSKFHTLALEKVKGSAVTDVFKVWLPTILIPLATLGVFVFYSLSYKDFFAYFHSGDNIHLSFPPFQIFNYSAPWVGTFWLEEIIFIYMFGVMSLLELIKQRKSEIAWFVGVFFVSTIFISHRDLLRYTLPIVPFVILALSDYLIKKEFRIVFLFLLIPIYLFSIAFISQNTMPISNWNPFL